MMHIMKVMLLLGLCYGLRGGKEISLLNCSNLKTGTFPNHHSLAGKTYVEVVVENSKQQRLSVYNAMILSTNLRIPVLPCQHNTQVSPGAVILRFMDKFHPEQERVFYFHICKNEKVI